MKIIKLAIALLSFAVVGMITGTTFGSTFYMNQFNTTSATKMNFWQYVLKLFGVSLPPDQGLTGNGLSGRMQVVGDHFEATGIPVTPYDDNMTWNPYQRAVVTMKNLSGNVIATTEVVLPVSDEMHCDKCHADGGAGAVGIRTGNVETNVLGPLGANPNCQNCHGTLAQVANSITQGRQPWLQEPTCTQCHGSKFTTNLSIGIRPEWAAFAVCHGGSSSRTMHTAGFSSGAPAPAPETD